MTQFFHIHPNNPQLRLIKQATQIIHAGGIVALPTDSCYTLVCHLDDKNALERLRRLCQVDEKHQLTLLCRDLREIAQYALVDNRQYRLLKASTPGPHVFILQATKEVPRRLSHPSRKTIGLQVPENRIVHALLEELGQPLLGIALSFPDEEQPLTDPAEIRDAFAHLIELVIDGGACHPDSMTVIDLTIN